MGRRRQIIGKSRLDSVDSLMGPDWLREQSARAVEESGLIDDRQSRDNQRAIGMRDRALRVAGGILIAASVMLAASLGVAFVWSLIGK